jgi:hypothetical protein
LGLVIVLGTLAPKQSQTNLHQMGAKETNLRQLGARWGITVKTPFFEIVLCCTLDIVNGQAENRITE